MSNPSISIEPADSNGLVAHCSLTPSIIIPSRNSSAVDGERKLSSLRMGFENAFKNCRMYTSMTTNNHNSHEMKEPEPSKRKASVKQAWEENYALKTEELRAEERRQSTIGGPHPRTSSAVSEQVAVVQRPAPFSLRRLLHIFRSKQFPDRNLEKLYRRYFVKVDQSSMSVMNIICIILCCMLIAFAYGSGHSSPLRGIVLGVIVILFIVLELLLYRLHLEFGSQRVLCYVSMLLLVGVICTISVDLHPAAMDDGLWVTVFFVYMVYTGMPVSLSIAVVAGIVMPLLQIGLTSRFLFMSEHHKSEINFVYIQNESLDDLLKETLKRYTNSPSLSTSPSAKDEQVVQTCREKRGLSYLILNFADDFLFISTSLNSMPFHFLVLRVILEEKFAPQV
ncbi:adenylate cyclase [Elysia marginata]|uniref:Adenylate cyclase n=1 Tax=Elysia marginata TaxID=1093978 RepID=A0AAV4EHQ0_9GAST|nr:adenylate cyclase [Elysia marginata]